MARLFPINCDFISSLDARHSSLASKVINKIFQRCQKCSDRLFSECLRCAFKLGLNDMATRVMSEDRSKLEEHYAFAVYYCAKYNWPEILIQLLDKGANVNDTIANCEWQTPLYCACKQGHKNVVELLIKRGARVNECNDMRCNGYKFPLQIASVKGDVEIVRLLIDNGASLDNRDDVTVGLSTKAHLLPLHLAFDNGHMEVVELLVQRGSCIDSTDPEGNTVFLKAAKSCRLDKMRQLLTLGASAKCVNKKKETALHLVLADETRGPAAASDCASTRVTGSYGFLSRIVLTSVGE
jgi:ankyrin repeat protein